MEEMDDDAESMEEVKRIEESDHERDGNLRIQSGVFITPISRLGGVNVRRSSLSASSLSVDHPSSPSF
ncbi:hypothetical protein K1719_045146 [Acacia pycnantha]|nr:hypothetical protein K1719_045146 [Acacia pycnantha]